MNVSVEWSGMRRESAPSQAISQPMWRRTLLSDSTPSMRNYGLVINPRLPRNRGGQGQPSRQLLSLEVEPRKEGNKRQS